MSLKDPIYKGCTRPALLMGVPMLPLVLFSGLCALAAMWAFTLVSGYVSALIVVFYAPCVVYMRQVTKKDDQRLKQLLLRARLRVRHRAGRSLWGATSFSPLRFKKR